MEKITYILGAGASFEAFPILGKMSEVMVNFSEFLLEKNRHEKITFTNGLMLSKYFRTQTIEDKFYANIGIYGQSSIEFNTIDTYAKKLFLTQKIDKYNSLKKAVSSFFNLFQVYKNNPDFIQRFGEYKSIDPRYISLLSVFLNKGKDGVPILDENINFITWNYDSQLELAYKKFSDSETGFDNFSKHIFHLNGVHDKFDINEESIDNFFKKTETGINYSWDWISQENEKYKKIKIILEESNTLVYIGYSFPHFNRNVDIELIKTFLKKSGNKKIIYQDPRAVEETILGVNYFIHKKSIKIDHSTDQFHLPNEYFNDQKISIKGYVLTDKIV